MTIRSGPKVRSASSIAWTGSASPTSPRAGMPSFSSSAMLRPSRSSAAARAWSSSEVQCLSLLFRAGLTTSTFARPPADRLLDRLAQRLAGDRLVRDDEDALLVVGHAAARRDGRPLARLAAEEPDGHRRGEDDEDAQPPPAPAGHSRDRDRPEVDDRPDHEPEGVGFASERVLHPRLLSGGGRLLDAAR